jgi:hypothetical protein
VCFAASCVRSAACWPGSSAWSRACSPESAGCSAGSSERVTAPGVTFAEPIWLRGRERVSRRTVALRSPSTKRPSGSHAGEAVTFRKPEQRVRSRLSSRAAERTRPLDRRLPAAGHSRHARPRRRRAADLRRSLPRDEPRPAGVRPVVQRQGTTRHGANALSPVKAGLKAIPGRAHFTPMSPQRKPRWLPRAIRRPSTAGQSPWRPGSSPGHTPIGCARARVVPPVRDRAGRLHARCSNATTECSMAASARALLSAPEPRLRPGRGGQVPVSSDR